VSHNSCIIPHFHKWCVCPSVFSHLRQHLLFSPRLIKIITLMSIRWYVILILFCISVMINDFEHHFMCMLIILVSFGNFHIWALCPFLKWVIWSLTVLWLLLKVFPWVHKVFTNCTYPQEMVSYLHCLYKKSLRSFIPLFLKYPWEKRYTLFFKWVSSLFVLSVPFPFYISISFSVLMYCRGTTYL
jgi:hypothetical protein